MLLSAKWLLNVPTMVTNIGHVPPASSPSNFCANAFGVTVGMFSIRVAVVEARAKTVELVSLDGKTSMELA